MKKYKVEVFNEEIEVEASNISAAVGKGLKKLQKKKVFKDKANLWLRIDVERVE